MKKFLLIMLSLSVLAASGTAHSQAIPCYYCRYTFLTAPPGAFQDGLLGFVNPANLALLNAPEARFYWSTKGVDAGSFQNWGLFASVPYLGFGMQRNKLGGMHSTDYKLSLGMGTDPVAFGIGYGWSSGDFVGQKRENFLGLGTIIRPERHLSIGLLGNISTESSAHEWVGELGVRPLGTSALTLFGDGAVQKGVKLKDAPWSAGAAVEVVSGTNIVGRYFRSKAFTLGLTINFGHGGFGAQGHYDTDQNLSGYNYYLRTGGMQPSILNTVGQKGKSFFPVNMKGRVDYQKYVFFDNNTIRFMDVLSNIRAAADDPRVGAIVLNLSAMNISPENAWEIREELLKARQSGKKVIIFFDNADMTTYHLASCADRLVMDPQGSLMLPGYALGKTYFKGTLAKLGLGFDEWRFFKYKSAAEVLSRDKMSEADREQYQNYLDDWYQTVKSDICQSRTISPEEYDKMINDEVYFMPETAVQARLVDTLARWSDLEMIVSVYLNTGIRGIRAGELLTNALPHRHWGPRPEIAVVYGLGECAMDTGIKARWLEQVFRGLARDRSVKAVVFRVDSPGGDGMASDLVAEALKKCAERKPIIVTQGQVAGSGGYWISMYGDSIIAGPNTITGSIGVIGGWLYDKGLTEKLGLTSDYVKRGNHADLGFGATIPFINARIPSRNLTTDERDKMEVIIKKFYDIFVAKVAQGRHLPVDSVKQIGQGHFYSGTQGKSIGLVDEVGGLMTALAMARTMAGIKPEQEVDILEVPKYKGAFNFPTRGLSPLPAGLTDEATYLYIKMVTDHPGQPLPMLLPGTYPSLK